MTTYLMIGGAPEPDWKPIFNMNAVMQRINVPYVVKSPKTFVDGELVTRKDDPEKAYYNRPSKTYMEQVKAALKKVKQEGLNLRHVGALMRKNKKVVLAAVKQYLSLIHI